MNVFDKDLKIIIIVMDQSKYLCFQTFLMVESSQHSGNILYKGQIILESIIRREISNGTISLQVRQYGRRKWIGLTIHLDSRLSILDRIIYL